MLKTKVHKAPWFFLGFAIVVYITGFLYKDLAPGGSQGDFNSFVWTTIQSFRADLSYSIRHYGTFGDANYPFFYIFQAYINPFSIHKIQYHISTFFLGFFTFLMFGYTVKKSSAGVSLLESFFAASTVLLLPFFLTRVYWGTSASLGWLLFVVSLFFLVELKNLEGSHVKANDKIILLFCFFSSLALYVRPAFVFLPIYYVGYLVFVNKNIRTLMVSLAAYLVFAIPGLMLLYVWGGMFDARSGMKGVNLYSFSHIPRNIPLLSSFFIFYLFPALLIETKVIGLQKMTSKYFPAFMVALVLQLLLLKLGFFDDLGKITLGGGAILKLNYFFKEGNCLLLIVASSAGLSVLYRFLRESFWSNAVILLPLFFIYGLPACLYQDYLEPLIIFFFFIGLIKCELYRVFSQNMVLASKIYMVYFFAYLVFSVGYKHFI